MHETHADDLGQVPKGKISVSEAAVLKNFASLIAHVFSFLTLPRLPFVEPSGGADIPKSALDSLSALLGNKHALAVLKLLKEASDEVRKPLRQATKVLS